MSQWHNVIKKIAEFIAILYGMLALYPLYRLGSWRETFLAQIQNWQISTMPRNDVMTCHNE
jgi:hypothetical protein